MAEYRKVKDRAILDYPVVIASLDTVQYDLALRCTEKGCAGDKQCSDQREQLKGKFAQAFKRSISKRQMVLTRDGLYQYDFKRKGAKAFVPSSHMERTAAEKEFELVMDKRWGVLVHRFEHLRDRESSLYGCALVLVRKVTECKSRDPEASRPKPRLKLKRSEPRFDIVDNIEGDSAEDAFGQVPVPILANDSRKLEGVVLLFSSLVSRRLWQDRLAMVVQKRPIDTAVLEIDSSSPFDSSSSNTSGNSNSTTFSQESKSSTATSVEDVKLTTLIESRDFSSSLWQELWKLNYGSHRHHRRAGWHGKNVSYDAVNGFEYPIKPITTTTTTTTTKRGNTNAVKELERRVQEYPERKDSMQVYELKNSGERRAQRPQKKPLSQAKRTITFADPIDNAMANKSMGSGSRFDPGRPAKLDSSKPTKVDSTKIQVSKATKIDATKFDTTGADVSKSAKIDHSKLDPSKPTKADPSKATKNDLTKVDPGRLQLAPIDAGKLPSQLDPNKRAGKITETSKTRKEKHELRMTTKINRYYQQAGVLMMRENKSASYKLSTPERSVVVATEPPLALSEPSHGEIVTVASRGPQ